MSISKEDVLNFFPISRPYRFIDEIISVDEKRIVGKYQFREDEFFFAGHFPGFPVVPGAILQETAAQIGLLAFGMYLLGNGLESLSELPKGAFSILSQTMSDVFTGNKQPDKLLQLMPGMFQDNVLSNIFYLTSAESKLKRIVRPGDTIIVTSEKIFFRLNKLKCNVIIETTGGEMVSKGTLSGVVVSENLWKTE